MDSCGTQSIAKLCIALSSTSTHAHEGNNPKVLAINLDFDDRQTHVSTPLRKFSRRFLTSRMIKYSRKMCASSSLVVHRYIQRIWSFSGKFHGSSAKDAANQNAHFGGDGPAPQVYTRLYKYNNLVGQFYL